MVEVGLRHGDLVDALTFDLIGNADRDALDPGEDIELGEEDVGQSVDARGIARDRSIEPAAATLASCRDADLTTDAAQSLTPLIVQLGRKGPDPTRVV